MGHEFSGKISMLGTGVDNIDVGQRVTVLPHLTCGHCTFCKLKKSNLCEEVKCIGGQANGAHADYICLKQDMVYPIPDTMSLEDAAMVEPACVGYHGSGLPELKGDDIVLVFGSGPIGVFAMQGCKARGCREVIVADYDQWRLELAETLGADKTINLQKENIDKGIERILGHSHKVDIFFDCVGGNGNVLSTIISLARRKAKIVVIGVQSDKCYVEKLPYIVEHELTVFGSNMYDSQDYADMLKLMGEGLIKTDGMITHHFKLDDVIKVFDFVVGKKEPFYKVMIEME
jgi:L-iditol 2-dehydrogenase